jgi:hypothetical protein
MAETEDLKTYRGNCHCGAFVFELKIAEIKAASKCNCSICQKKGYLFTFPGDVMTVVKGEDSLKVYTFNEGNTKHQACLYPRITHSLSALILIGSYLASSARLAALLLWPTMPSSRPE